MFLSNKFNELQKKHFQRRLDKKLLSAALRSDVSQVKNYLKLGANPNARTFWNKYTPLMLAAADTWLNSTKAVMGYLLQNKADINARDRQGNTALHHALSGDRFYSVREVTKFLLDAGIDASAVNNHKKSALVTAHLKENSGLADFLEKYGDPAVQKKNFLRGIINLSSSANEDVGAAYFPVLRGLVSAHGVDVNTMDSNSMTALHWLATFQRKENIPFIQFLLDRGANPLLRDNIRRRAIDITPIKSVPEISDMLQRAAEKFHTPPGDNPKALTEEGLKNAVFLKEDLVIGKPLQLKRKWP